jgi:transposase-like protein
MGFRWGRFEPPAIPMVVAWHVYYGLSFRHAEELMQERRLLADPLAAWQQRQQ